MLTGDDILVDPHFAEFVDERAMQDVAGQRQKDCVHLAVVFLYLF